jgi:hypothetical protein
MCVQKCCDPAASVAMCRMITTGMRTRQCRVNNRPLYSCRHRRPSTILCMCVCTFRHPLSCTGPLRRMCNNDFAPCTVCPLGNTTPNNHSPHHCRIDDCDQFQVIYFFVDFTGVPTQYPLLHPQITSCFHCVCSVLLRSINVETVVSPCDLNEFDSIHQLRYIFVTC